MDSDAGGFRRIWQVADAIPGWLKRDQAVMLFTEAASLPAGAKVLEIGSHQGRSTIVLAEAVRAHGGTVIAVDPFVDGRLFGGKPTRDLFEQHLTSSGVADLVRLVPDYSTRIRGAWQEPVDLLYIDGKHDYWTLSDDLRWKEFLPADGRILVHDAFSSIGVTLGILAHVLCARDVRYLTRADSLALFEKGPASAHDRLRLLAQLPWWIRNVGIKVILRLRLRPIARLLGHDSPYDPY